MRKSHIWLIVVSVLLLSVGIGATVAFLLTSSATVNNTFTVGAVNITLAETTGNDYKMAPGMTIAKDPTVTVLANSETCWLFVKVEQTGNFDSFCSYELADGWTTLPGYSGIYYRLVERASTDTVFPVLKNNSILVHDTLTEEQLDAVTQKPTLRFTAYAAQRSGVNTPEDAWKLFDP